MLKQNLKPRTCVRGKKGAKLAHYRPVKDLDRIDLVQPHALVSILLQRRPPIPRYRPSREKVYDTHGQQAYLRDGLVRCGGMVGADWW